MEKKFFTVVRTSGLLIAFVAIIATLIFGVVGGSMMLASADSELSVNPSSLASYQELLSPNKKSPVSETPKEIEVNEDKIFNEEMEGISGAIHENFTQYASDLKQQGVVDKKRVFAVLQNMVSNVDDHDVRRSFFNGLKQVSADLLLKAPELKKLPPSDQRRVRWMGVLEWYQKDFMTNLQEENQRVSVERIEASLSNAKGMVYLGIASGFLLLFMFFTLMLAMLRIEKNTRAAS